MSFWGSEILAKLPHQKCHVHSVTGQKTTKARDYALVLV
jgi:hypothetical protein